MLSCVDQSSSRRLHYASSVTVVGLLSWSRFLASGESL
jgi:hypothetical protein